MQKGLKTKENDGDQNGVAAVGLISAPIGFVLVACGLPVSHLMAAQTFVHPVAPILVLGATAVIKV